jgi:hypothetical protein
MDYDGPRISEIWDGPEEWWEKWGCLFTWVFAFSFLIGIWGGLW